jgi:hypothetical protein
MGKDAAGDRLQIQGLDQFGDFVQPGFSGTPILDIELAGALGMVFSVYSKQDKRLAYAYPGSILADAWNILKESALQIGKAEARYSIEIHLSGKAKPLAENPSERGAAVNALLVSLVPYLDRVGVKNITVGVKVDNSLRLTIDVPPQQQAIDFLQEWSEPECRALISKHLKEATSEWFDNGLDGIDQIQIRFIAPKTDLRWADLSGASLSDADLSEAILSEADLNRTDLRRADLRGTDLSKADLREANLSDADLSDADLRGANLRHTNLIGANLSGAYLNECNYRC